MMSDQINNQSVSSTTDVPASHALPGHFRLTSLVRLPSSTGKGIYNEATLYHDDASLRVSWRSCQVDSRFRRGCYVEIRGEGPKEWGDFGAGECTPISRLELLDKPIPGISPFQMLPPNWVGDRSLVARAQSLWDQLSRPFQHLINAVFLDPGRFYRFVTGPASPADYYQGPNGNFRHAVETAERIMLLASGLPDVSSSVMIAAALLHDAGKADDYRLSSECDGYVLSERGLWIGYQHTILEWLAVARSRVIVPDAQYLALVHALIAARGSVSNSESRSTEAIILSVADRMAQSARLHA